MHSRAGRLEDTAALVLVVVGQKLLALRRAGGGGDRGGHRASGPTVAAVGAGLTVRVLRARAAVAADAVVGPRRQSSSWVNWTADALVGAHVGDGVNIDDVDAANAAACALALRGSLPGRVAKGIWRTRWRGRRHGRRGRHGGHVVDEVVVDALRPDRCATRHAVAASGSSVRVPRCKPMEEGLSVRGRACGAAVGGRHVARGARGRGAHARAPRRWQQDVAGR